MKNFSEKMIATFHTKFQKKKMKRNLLIKKEIYLKQLQYTDLVWIPIQINWRKKMKQLGQDEH